MKGFVATALGVVLLAGLVPALGHQHKKDPRVPLNRCELTSVWGATVTTERFVPVFDGQAYCDQETGLIWETSPATTKHAWTGSDLAFACANKAVGGRKGWRVPSIHELASLVDPSVPAPGPTLPPDHPFANVQPATYWSATTVAALPTNGWLLTFASGDINSNPKDTLQHVWCVRGGGVLDTY